MSKEEQFYQALQGIFIGAPVQGESGYINLMCIKSRYYQTGVFPQLQQDIEQALKPFPDFRDELFLKLYSFFKRYFSKSGSIYFDSTPADQNTYEKVYTDDPLRTRIDIPETLSNLLGKYIKKIRPTAVESENGDKIDLNNLDYKLIKPLIWW